MKYEEYKNYREKDMRVQTYSLEKKFTFDDILLVPQYSDIESLDNEVSTATDIGSLHLGLPVIAAAMTSVTDSTLARAMILNCGTAIYPRYFPTDFSEENKYNSLLNRVGLCPIAVSPSMGTALLRRVYDGYTKDLNNTRPPVAVIDVAHGDSRVMFEFADWLVGVGYEVWSGNIVTLDAAKWYVRAGVKAIKVGIGPGAACTTRVVTGHGYPQASAILEIASGLEKAGMRDKVSIIADGGISTSGDIVKALALGADAVMVGRMLVGTEESPAETKTIYKHKSYGMDGMTSVPVKYKRYAGMASELELSKAGKTVRVEGTDGWVPVTGSVTDVMEQIRDGLKLGMRYSGVRSIKELQQGAQFVFVTESSIREGAPRI